MKFLDKVTVFVRGGAGGAGCASFSPETRRPDGGDGGTGGRVMARATRHVSTLGHFRRHRHTKAANGKHGGSRGKTGANGADTWLAVPLGTQIINQQHLGSLGSLGCLGSLDQDGQKMCLAHGGTGGRGNRHNATTGATKGEDGEEHHLLLRLKLLADAGLVGLPNAGKSTLLRCLSCARPEVGDYPFTTKTPVLGVVESTINKDFVFENFVLADVPGLVAGGAQRHWAGVAIFGTSGAL